MCTSIVLSPTTTSFPQTVSKITSLLNTLLGLEVLDILNELDIDLTSGLNVIIGGSSSGKTLLVDSIAQSLDLSFHRIQFTPDLMPSDITGTDVLQEDPITHERGYQFIKGPIFANMLLGDEINRTPPKTQAAMLEAMQERIVSTGGKTYKLPDPFFVLATQNPIDQEGTYPLPEAQLDRFLLHIKVDYPNHDEEWDIARRVSSGVRETIQPVMGSKKILEAQQLVQSMPVCDQVVGLEDVLDHAVATQHCTDPTLHPVLGDEDLELRNLELGGFHEPVSAQVPAVHLEHRFTLWIDEQGVAVTNHDRRIVVHHGDDLLVGHGVLGDLGPIIGGAVVVGGIVVVLQAIKAGRARRDDHRTAKTL